MYTDREDVIKVLAALVIAIVAFVTRKVGMDVAAAVLILAALAAVLRARTEIREAIKPKCQ